VSTPLIEEGVKKGVAKSGKIVLEDENCVTSKAGGARSASSDVIGEWVAAPDFALACVENLALVVAFSIASVTDAALPRGVKTPPWRCSLEHNVV
jgi:hypothetical protein